MPDGIDADSLCGLNVPNEMIADHPDIAAAQTEQGQRMLKNADVRLPEAELLIDENELKIIRQPKARSFRPLPL